MLGLGKLLTKRLRFKLIKNNLIQKVIIRKNNEAHNSTAYSIINFTRLFDVDYYLKINPDVADAGWDPIEHYIKLGAAELRNPAPWFISTEYLEKHPHLKKGDNLFLDFILNSNEFPDLEYDEYQHWIQLYDKRSASEKEEIKKTISQWEEQPLISILLPTYNSNITYLKQAIDSIKDQLYTRWELCIADDASTDADVIKLLNVIKAKDDRIKVFFRKTNGHISDASNSALELATAEYLILMDHDDLLPQNALFEIVKTIRENERPDLIYSDEDKIDENNRRFDPYFKPNWNRDLLYGQNYISHLTAYRTEIIKKIGGFRKGYEGSQDYDLLLRYLDKINEKDIHHIPKILYHWRATAGSTALNINEKEYAVEAGRKALEDHMKRNSIEGEVTITLKTQYRVKRKLKEEPHVSIVIPFKDQPELLKNCISGIEEVTDYTNYEILLIDNRSEERETIEFLNSIKSPNVSRLQYSGMFNFSAINNFAAAQTKGEILLFLNNDTKPINREWLYEMVSHAMRPEVGVVGAKLFYEDDTVQHAGVILGMGGVACHWYSGSHKDYPGHMARASLVQELSAVTGACMAIRKSVFEKTGGFEEDLRVAFNDINLCLKLRKEGYKVIYTPFAQLYHYESKSRGSDLTDERRDEFAAENEYMFKKWDNEIGNDPFYNPNLSLQLNGMRFAFPPRH